MLELSYNLIPYYGTESQKQIRYYTVLLLPVGMAAASALANFVCV